MTRVPRPVPVSVVIPTYNAGRYLKEALTSVINQTVSVFEVIVVDDCSDDDSAQIAASVGARVIYQQNKGVSAARNTGIRAATGEWIALLDADDLWEPNKIECQWNLINECPDVQLIASDYCRFGSQGIILKSYLQSLGNSYGRIAARELREGLSYFRTVEKEFFECEIQLWPSSVLVRKQTLLDIGLFDESLRFAEDVECFARLLTRCPLGIVEIPLVKYRIHESNATTNVVGCHLDFIRVIERMAAHPANYPRAYTASCLEVLPEVLNKTGRRLLLQKGKRDARRHFWRSFKIKPRTLTLTLLAASLLPLKLIDLGLAARQLIRAN